MKVKQNIISFLLGALLMLPVGTYATTQFIAKAVDVPIFVDDQQVNTTVYAIEDRNYTSVRDVAEAMGGTVMWDDVNKKIDIETPKTDVERVVKDCKNSCVMIYVCKNDVVAGQGSGFVYNGYIITAKHVTDLGDKYLVYRDDSILGMDGTLVDVETDLDVSVLYIKTNLPSVTLGNSDRLKEGQKLIAITSPGGAKNAVDVCLYSGIGYNHGNYYVGISDTFITGGSSGGAIFDLNSRVIGMASEGQPGRNYAIPINDIKPILEKLK